MRLGDAEIGDKVQCQFSGYHHIRRGQVLTVMDKDHSCFILPNPASERGFSRFKPENFSLFLSRPNQQEKKSMLHIAVKIPAGWCLDDMVSSINHWNSTPGVKEDKPITHPDNLFVDMSQDALKARLRVRISAHPDEQWLILSGNTIAETASPPVRFRSV